jgi:hypothetical protein
MAMSYPACFGGNTPFEQSMDMGRFTRLIEVELHAGNEFKL